MRRRRGFGYRGARGHGGQREGRGRGRGGRRGGSQADPVRRSTVGRRRGVRESQGGTRGLARGEVLRARSRVADTDAHRTLQLRRWVVAGQERCAEERQGRRRRRRHGTVGTGRTVGARRGCLRQAVPTSSPARGASARECDTAVRGGATRSRGVAVRRGCTAAEGGHVFRGYEDGR